MVQLLPKLRRSLKREVPRWVDTFGQYGIEVSFGGRGTLNIVITSKNTPKPMKHFYGWKIITPSEGGGVNQRT